MASLGALGTGALASLTGCANQTSSTPTTASSSSTPTLTPTPTRTPTPTPTPKPTPTKPPAPKMPWDGVASPLPKGAVNVLILGTDNKTDVGNTDVIVLAQLSADRQRVTLVGFPRDCEVNYAEGGSGKINAALFRAGIDNTKATISDLLGGLPIHYVAQTNFGTFPRLCQLMSGFGVINKVESSVTSTVTGRTVEFPEGKLVLWGNDWLVYARQRHGLPMSEFDRGERHRAIVTGMTKLLQYLAYKQPARLASIAQGVFQYANIYGGITKANILGTIPSLRQIKSFTSLRVAASFSDTVVIDQDQLGDLAYALKNDKIAAYVKQYGTN